MISSSRPVNDTGWNERNEIFFGLSSANWMMRPTCSLFTPLTIVVTGTMSTPARPEVLDRAQLDVEQVADQAVRVGRVADAVELQVRVAQARFGRRLREIRALGELDAVGRRLHAVVADLARVAHRVEEVRRERRLAARELHRHLPLRLDRDRVVEQRLDLFPAELVHEPDLVRVHEARVAHHVAAVRQVDRQHRRRGRT